MGQLATQETSTPAPTGWLGRLQGRWLRNDRDRTFEGFQKAAGKAFAEVEAYAWNSLADAADEIALTLGEELGVEDTGAKFVAVHAATGRHRVKYWAGAHGARGDVTVVLADPPATGNSRS